ncbi:MAG: hypothetical protein QOH15_504 [Gaiellales bacterium]|jgi:hypothetical protein|nr:hypothetical protein [Gaiellales bacterium]
MARPIDRTVFLNGAFDVAFARYDDGTTPGSGDELEPGHPYHAVVARETVHDGLISTDVGTRAVVWDLGIETEHGTLWIPDTMLDPPYSDI